MGCIHGSTVCILYILTSYYKMVWQVIEMNNSYCTNHPSSCKVLWILPYEWLRWCSIVVALCLSGSVLVMTFWPAVRDDHPKIIIAVLSAIVVLNILLAVGCKVNV